MQPSLIWFGIAAMVGVCFGTLACGTSLSSQTQGRIQNCLDLAASLKRDVPDSGPVALKTQALYCNLQGVMRDGKVPVPATSGSAALFDCPKAMP